MKINRPKGNAPAASTVEALRAETPQPSKESEMNSTPNPKSGASQAHLLPTLEQVINLAITKAETDLVRLGEIRMHDPEWGDVDVDIDLTTDLALDKVRAIKEQKFARFDEFLTQWYKASSALNLGEAAFSRKDCWYHRQLKNTCQLFEQMAYMVEFVGLKGEKA